MVCRLCVDTHGTQFCRSLRQTCTYLLHTACVDPRRVSAQGFVGALDFLLGRHVSPDIGVVRVESEFVFPSDHYLVRLRLLTLPTLVAPRNRTSWARFKLGGCLSMAGGGLCG